jgi:hypothetical protein
MSWTEIEKNIETKTESRQLEKTYSEALQKKLKKPDALHWFKAMIL